MLEPVEILTPNGPATIFAGCPASRHGSAKCRILQPERFHAPATFLATFIDAPASYGGWRAVNVAFDVPRCLALGVATQLFMARNALLHNLQGPCIDFVATPLIDGIECVIAIEPGGWFTLSCSPVFEDLSIYGVDAVDDFCSSFLGDF